MFQSKVINQICKKAVSEGWCKESRLNIRSLIYCILFSFFLYLVIVVIKIKNKPRTVLTVITKRDACVLISVVIFSSPEPKAHR